MNTYEEIRRLEEAVVSGNVEAFEHVVNRLRDAVKWQAHLKMLARHDDGLHDDEHEHFASMGCRRCYRIVGEE